MRANNYRTRCYTEVSVTLVNVISQVYFILRTDLGDFIIQKFPWLGFIAVYFEHKKNKALKANIN